MNLTTFAIEKRTVTYFAALVLVLAGIASFFRLGQLEDPEFTIKTAVITTAYPGATPEEVELEVTDRIEKAMQQLEELDHLESVSRAGVSTVKVDIKPSYWSDELQQVWDKVRRKVNDVRASLPPGAGEPTVNDDFGDVFGLLLAITSDGYTYAELEDYAEDLRRELSLVPGVAKVEFWGVQRKVIYVDVAQTQLTQLGIGIRQYSDHAFATEHGGRRRPCRRPNPAAEDRADGRVPNARRHCRSGDPPVRPRRRVGASDAGRRRVRRRVDPHRRYRDGQPGLRRPAAHSDAVQWRTGDRPRHLQRLGRQCRRCRICCGCAAQRTAGRPPGRH